MGKFICSSNEALIQPLEISNTNAVLFTTNLNKNFVDFTSQYSVPEK
jgi:hypothetical protein